MSIGIWTNRGITGESYSSMTDQVFSIASRETCLRLVLRLETDLPVDLLDLKRNVTVGVMFDVYSVSRLGVL